MISLWHADGVPDTPGALDTVFPSGVLYHRKSPLEHMEHLKSFLRPDRGPVIETLVVVAPRQARRTARSQNYFLKKNNSQLCNMLIYTAYL